MKPRNETQLNAILDLARHHRVEAPAYLEVQVLARSEERKRSRRTLFFWQSIASASLALGTLVFAMVQMRTSDLQSTMVAELGKPYVVRMEIAEFSSEIVEAEVVLPNGVTFYSKNLPELSKERSLQLAWTQGEAPNHLPFVIKGEQNGEYPVTVKFWGADKKLISQKTLMIQVTKNEESKNLGAS